VGRSQPVGWGNRWDRLGGEARLGEFRLGKESLGQVRLGWIRIGSWWV
jgi:hypothetical protein